jgi:hypothetical protein
MTLTLPLIAFVVVITWLFIFITYFNTALARRGRDEYS